jgi:NADPH:quinone reductase-like Zn-dependent oxidoreductase
MAGAVPRRSSFPALGELVGAGTLRHVIERAYPLAEAAQALAHAGQGHTAGKVVVAVP